MTQNHSTGDNLVSLPDLSEFQDEEKQHILDVLMRDEDLRNQHLARFLNLRKEVTELEQQSQKTSTSVCARCQSPFGYIFNTGDACPKCTAKVCKQCRLLYNLNDNSWLCLLCSKQMQLMSYSGEWIYVLHSNLQKKSPTLSTHLENIDVPSVSTQNIHMASTFSSSDSDSNDTLLSGNKSGSTKANSKFIKVNKMARQKATDEAKLKFVKQRFEDRPETISLTKQSNNITSSLFSLPVEQKETNFNQENIDIEKQKINKGKPKVKHLSNSSTRESKLTLSNISSSKSSRKHLSVSMLSLRDIVHRIPRPTHSSSRVSLNSNESKPKKVSHSSTNADDDDDVVSIKVPEYPSRTSMYT